MRRDETFTIEEHYEACSRCLAARNLKTAHNLEPAEAPKLWYPWQQAVLDAFTEMRPEVQPLKVNVAQRAISARLCDPTPADSNEQLAIREALQGLRVLLPEPKKMIEDSEKKAIA